MKSLACNMPFTSLSELVFKPGIAFLQAARQRRWVLFFGMLLGSTSVLAQTITVSTGATSNITSSTSGGVVTYTLTNSGSNGVLNASDIVTQLNAGNSVTVSAVLDLWISSPLTWTSSNKLTLIAGQYLRVNANITSSTGNGPAEFQGVGGLSVASTTNVRISTGTGDITFISDWIAFDGFLTSPNPNTTTIATTGTLSIVPFNNNFSAETLGGSDGQIGSFLDWSGTVNGSGHFNFVSDFHNLTIENYASLGGLVLGKMANTNTVNINGGGIGIAGAISIYGGSINLNANLQTTLASGDILVHSNGNVATNNNGSITTANAAVQIIADADANGSGTYNGSGLTVNPGSGNVLIRGAEIADAAQTINGTGTLTIEPSAASFTSALTLNNITTATTLTGLQLGKSGNTANITVSSARTIAGPISLYGRTISINHNLTSTATNAHVKIYSTGVGTSGLTNGVIYLATSRSITTNGGDIVLWSNMQNLTGVQANNEIILDGSNTLSTSGGKIVLAGGLDDGSNGGTASDGIPDGYSYRGGYSGEAIDIRTNVTLNSGGGEIIIRGEQNGSDVAVGADATFTLSNGGAVTIDGKNTTGTSVNLGTANITSTAANAPVTISGTTHITNTGLTTITTSGGDVLLASNTDDATDGEATTNGYIRMGSGLSITTNGGSITLGGSNASGTNYALGSSNTLLTEGIRIDGTVNLNSGNGTIALRGKSYATAVANGVGAAGVMFYNVTSGSINSGTGTILLDGYSQTTGGNAIAGLLWWNNPTASSFTIQSANTTASAITLNGYSTSSTGESYGIEVESITTLNVYATGTGGGISINGGRSQSNTVANENLDIVFRGPVNVLANSGPISIKGGQLGGVTNGYWLTNYQTQIGSATAGVTTSSSDITIAFDRFWFDGNYYPKLATGGTVTIEPINVGFGMGVSSAWFQFNQNSQTMTGLTIGKPTNTAAVTMASAPSIAGPISVYAGDITVSGNLNTSAGGATGTILLKATGNITQSSGSDVTTDGADVIYWADSDENNAGYINFSGSGYDIVTNGGDVIMAGGAGTTVPTGYAHGGTAAAGINFDVVTTRGAINTTKNSATGGNIILRGKTTGAYSGIYTSNLQFFGNDLTLDGVTGSTGTNDFAVRLGSSNIYNGSNLSQVIDLDNNLNITAINTAANYAGNALRSGVNQRVYVDGDITINSSGKINYTSTQTFINIATSKTFTISFDGTTDFTTPVGDPTTGTPQGAMVVQSYQQSSFTSAFSTSAWTFNSNLSSLTIGKPTNAATVTVASAQSIAGPITIYGGAVDVNADLIATGGSILLDADLGGTGLPTGLDGINVADNVTIQTVTSGDITMIGRSGNGNVSNVMGYRDYSGTTINAAGALAITGYSNSTSNTGTRGFVLTGSYTADGNITLIGQDDTRDDATFNGARITATNGGISLYANTNLSPGVSGSFYTYGTNILTANNDISLYADAMYLSPSVIDFNTLGEVNFLPRSGSNSFTVGLTLGAGITFDAGVTGLTVGSTTSTANIAIPAATIAGPITLFGGTISLNANLTTTNGGDISFYTDNALGGLSSIRTITANGVFKLIPQSSSFSNNISYPITNLSVNSNGLTIGKVGSTNTITLNDDLTTSGPIQLFGGTLALNNNVTCTDIELAGTATLAVGKFISASGNLTNNGTLNLSASSSGYSQLKVDGNVTNNGVVVQEQFMSSTGHHGISSPMNSGFTTSSGTASALYGYDASSGAWASPGSGTASVGAGFFAPVQSSNGFQSATGTFSVTGTPNTSHTHTLGYSTLVAAGGSGAGWNLIGNPYTCGLNWTSANLSKTNVNAAIYIWDPSTSTYKYYVDGVSAPNGSWGGGSNAYAGTQLASGVIAPMQAFWVQASASGGSIVSSMANDGSVASTPTFYKSTPDNLILSAVDLSDQSLSDALWITHAAGYSNDFEGDRDAWKLSNYGGQANIYSYHNGEMLAINATDLSSATSIPVGIKAPATGTKYKLVLEQVVNNQDYQVILEDKFFNSFTDISNQPYYVTSGLWQNEEPRFVLHVSPSTLGMDDQTDLGIKVYQEGDRLVIHGDSQKHHSYSLFSLDGRNLGSGNLSAGMASITAPQVGVYIIQIDGESPVAQRVIVQ